MNRLGTTLSQVLIGTLIDDADPRALVDAMIAAGQAPDEVVLLTGSDGLDELLGHDPGHGILGHLTHLIRHIESLDSEGTGHVLTAAERDLRAGHTVVLVLHVRRSNAAPLSDLLQVFGVPHVHYIGRWTVAQHGTIPAAAGQHPRRVPPTTSTHPARPQRTRAVTPRLPSSQRDVATADATMA